MSYPYHIFHIMTQVSACIIHLAWNCANCPFQPCVHWHHPASRSASPVLTIAIQTALCIPWQSSLFQPKGSDALLQEQQCITNFTKLSCGAGIEPLYLFVPLSKTGLWTCRRWFVVKSLDSSQGMHKICTGVLPSSVGQYAGCLELYICARTYSKKHDRQESLEIEKGWHQNGQGTITDLISEL